MVATFSKRLPASLSSIKYRTRDWRFPVPMRTADYISWLCCQTYNGNNKCWTCLWLALSIDCAAVYWASLCNRCHVRLIFLTCLALPLACWSNSRWELTFRSVTLALTCKAYLTKSSTRWRWSLPVLWCWQSRPLLINWFQLFYRLAERIFLNKFLPRQGPKLSEHWGGVFGEINVCKIFFIKFCGSSTNIRIRRKKADAKWETISILKPRFFFIWTVRCLVA